MNNLATDVGLTTMPNPLAGIIRQYEDIEGFLMELNPEYTRCNESEEITLSPEELRILAS